MRDGVMTGDTAQRMDRMYRYQRHIYDATRKFYLLGRDGLIERMSLLPGRLDPGLLRRWRYEEALSRELTERDRSAIYGGFHLYVLEG